MINAKTFIFKSHFFFSFPPFFFALTHHHIMPSILSDIESSSQDVDVEVGTVSSPLYSHVSLSTFLGEASQDLPVDEQASPSRAAKRPAEEMDCPVVAYGLLVADIATNKVYTARVVCKYADLSDCPDDEDSLLFKELASRVDAAIKANGLPFNVILPFCLNEDGTLRADQSVDYGESENPFYVELTPAPSVVNFDMTYDGLDNSPRASDNLTDVVFVKSEPIVFSYECDVFRINALDQDVNGKYTIYVRHPSPFIRGHLESDFYKHGTSSQMYKSLDAMKWDWSVAEISPVKIVDGLDEKGVVCKLDASVKIHGEAVVAGVRSAGYKWDKTVFISDLVHITSGAMITSGDEDEDSDEDEDEDEDDSDDGEIGVKDDFVKTN